LNGDGYNIFLASKNSKGNGTPIEDNTIMWIDVITIMINANRELITEQRALQRIEEINTSEFHESADILDTGENFWLLIRIPRQNFQEPNGYIQFINKFRRYLMNLGIKWNIPIMERLSFEINPKIFFPGFIMPAAGMLNHNNTLQGINKWICKGTLHQDEYVLSKILKTRNPYDEIKTIDRILSQDMINKYGSVMEINPNFTIDSFLKYIDEKKKLHIGALCRADIGKNVFSLENDLDLVIFLRANFKAGPGVIEYILLMNRNESGKYGLLPDKDSWFHILKLVLEADKYIMQQRQLKSSNDQMKRDGGIANEMSFMSLLSGIPFFRDIQSKLVTKYGSEIHFAHRGMYLLKMGNSEPEEFLLRHPTTNRIHSFQAFPCNFLIQADSTNQKKGTIVIPSQIAENFSKNIHQFRTGSPIAVYFWYYANRFVIASAPQHLANGGDVSIQEFLSWLYDNNAEMFKLWKTHSLDRERKGSFWAKIGIEDLIPSATIHEDP
jgi:hypothetical protein